MRVGSRWAVGNAAGVVALAVAAIAGAQDLQPASGLARSVVSDRVSVIVRLQDEPGYRAYLAAGGRGRSNDARMAASARMAAIASVQADLVSRAKSLGAVAQNRVQFIDNAVAFDIARDQVAALAKLPGVVAVAPDRRYAPEHTTSAPLVHATDVWQGSAGGQYTGQGVTIAIIDSGVDYTHAHFGGNQNYAGNDPTIIGDANWPPAALPVNPGDQLVIGGHDFVGDGYSAGVSPPVPDPDPTGCELAHGTHVAGSAAGWGVTAAGDTYIGGYASGDSLFPSYPAASLTAFRVGPGMAPRANLVSLRVFGCNGSTSTAVLLAAMDAAGAQTWLGQDVDVVNMSLGSSYGGTGPDDFLMGAQQALTDLGIVVVTSAGNSGDFQLSTGAPGTAAATISVANIVDSAAVVDGRFSYTPGGAAGIAAAKGVMFPAGQPDPLPGSVVIGVDTVAPIGDGCTALSGVAGTYTGKWVIVDRGLCNFSIKVANVKAAGGLGAIVVNNVTSAPFSMATTAGNDDVLPAIMVGLADGNALKTAVGSGAVSGSYDDGVPSSVADDPLVVDSSTSRGGLVRGSGDRILKPNLAAPGATITSAGAGTNDLGYTISGTSMASPHVAGIAALAIQALGRPNDAAGVARIKQRLMNTANTDIKGTVAAPVPYQSPQRVGAGLVDAVSAITTQVVAYAQDAPENVSLSFGYPKHLAGTPPLVLHRTVVVQNVGNTAQTFNVVYQPRSIWPGATVGFQPSQVTVPAGGSANIDVSLTINASQPDLNVGGDPLFTIASKSILHEVSGLLALTPTSGAQPVVRVPIYAAPHISADTGITESLALDRSIGTSSIQVSGTGYNTGPNANDHVSLVSAYELLVDDGVEQGLSWDADGDGVEPTEALSDYAYADLQYVGATLAPPLSSTRVLDVGLKMHGEWTSPRDLFVEIYVDVDNDQVEDYVWYYGSGVSDAFAMNFVALADGGAYTLNTLLNYAHGASLDSMLFKNNVMSLPVTVSHAAFTGGAFPNYVGGPIHLRVRTYQRDSDFEVVVDEAGMTYNGDVVVSPTGSITRNLFVGASGQSIGFATNLVDPVATRRILTLHHQADDPGKRGQVTVLDIDDRVCRDGFD